MSQWFQFNFADFSYSFVSLLLEGVPFILLGTLVSGFLDQFLSPRLLTRSLPKQAYVGVMLCAAMGLVFPLCECAVVPVIRRLLGKGLPLSYGVAYMLAAPVVNPLVALSTLAAFRGQSAWEMMLLRLGTAWLVAVIAGWAVHNLSSRWLVRTDVLRASLDARGGFFESDAFRSGPLLGRCGRALRVGAADFLEVLFYFVLGVGLATVFNTAVDQTILLPVVLDELLATATLMGLAFLLSLCSTSDAFIAATLVLFPPASKLAFLVFGPMFDLKLLMIYRMVFTWRFIAGMGLGLFILVGLLSLRLAFLLP